MAVTGPAWSDEVPLVTGEHWTQSNEQVKKAYLVGIANALQIESAYQGSNPPSDAQSLVPAATVGLKGQTLDSVRATVDAYYSSHPNDLRRPVFEVIWMNVVVPGRAKAAPK
jgi:hypothetical protein